MLQLQEYGTHHQELQSTQLGKGQQSLRSDLLQLLEGRSLHQQVPTAKKVRIGKRVAAPPGGHRGAAWDNANQLQQQKSQDQEQEMSGAYEYGCGFDRPLDLSTTLLFLSLQHGMLEQQSCQNVSHT